MATGDMHKNREDRSSGSRDMLADSQTHTDRQTDRNTPLSYRGGVIIKPLDVVVGGLWLYCQSIFYLSFRQLPAQLTEGISTKTCHMFRRKCDLKVNVQNLGYPSP